MSDFRQHRPAGRVVTHRRFRSRYVPLARLTRSRVTAGVRARRDVSLTAPSVPRQTGGESTTFVLPLRRETSSGCTGDSPGIPTGRRRAPGILIGSPADVTGWPWWRRRPPAVCRESGRCCAGRRPQTAATGSRTTAERQQPPATPPTPGRRHSPRRDNPRAWRSPAPPSAADCRQGWGEPIEQEVSGSGSPPTEQGRSRCGSPPLLHEKPRGVCSFRHIGTVKVKLHYAYKVRNLGLFVRDCVFA